MAERTLDEKLVAELVGAWDTGTWISLAFAEQLVRAIRPTITEALDLVRAALRAEHKARRGAGCEGDLCEVCRMAYDESEPKRGEATFGLAETENSFGSEKDAT